MSQKPPKIVLDESVPRPLARKLREAGLDVSAFPNDWKGTKNGHLLAHVRQAGFDGLLTCDKNLAYQQRVDSMGPLIAVLPIQDMESLLANAGRIALWLTAWTPEGGVLRIELDARP